MTLNAWNRIDDYFHGTVDIEYRGETFSYNIAPGADGWDRFMDAFQQTNFTKWMTIVNSFEELEALRRQSQYSCLIDQKESIVHIAAFGNVSSEECNSVVRSAGKTVISLYLYYICIAIGFLFGITGNCLGLALSLSPNLRRMTMSIHLVVLSLTGLVSIVTMGVVVIRAEIVRTLSLFECPFVYALLAFCDVTSSFVNLALTAERFVSIAHPLKAKSWLQRKRVIIVDICILIFSAAAAAPIGYLTISVSGACFSRDPTVQLWYRYIVYRGLGKAVPFLVSLVLVSLTLHKVRTTVAKRVSDVREKDRERTSRRLTRYFAAFCLVNTLTNLPVLVLDTYNGLSGSRDFNFYIVAFALNIFDMSTAFYILILPGRMYRDQLKQVCCFR